jgi:toxin secretion/phage lysis holin
MEGKKIMATEPTTNSFFTAITGGGFATASYLLGGIDNLIIALGFFMMIDYATGVMVGFMYKNVSSQRAYRGVFKKAGMAFMILVAVQVDIITGNTDMFLRDAIMMILIGTEGISILENLGKLGVPIPAILTESLERLTEGKGKNKEFVEEIIRKETTVSKEIRPVENIDEVIVIDPDGERNEM